MDLQSAFAKLHLRMHSEGLQEFFHNRSINILAFFSPVTAGGFRLLF